MLDIHGDTVRFRIRVNRKHPDDDGVGASTDGRGERGGSRVTTLPGTEFIRRLMQHVCPTGFKRIRCHRLLRGLLAPAAKAQRMATARALLAMPAANPVAAEAVDEFMQRVAGIAITRCPHCASGRWITIGAHAPLPSRHNGGGLTGYGSSAVRSSQGSATCRGPP